MDDDPTLLFSGSLSSILPPRPDKPISQPPIAKAPPLPNLRGGLRGPHRPEIERPRADPEDRTILRPVPADLLPRRSPMPPAPIEADRRPARNSDVGDPAPTVNTAKVRVVRAASRQSATAALVAVGAFVGLVIAMIARGDASGVIGATASLIDPSHAAAAGGPAAAPVQFTLQQQTLDAPPKPMPAGSEPSSNAGALSAVIDPVSPTVAPIVISAAAPHQASPPRVEPPPTPRASAPAVVAAPAPARAASRPSGGSQAAAHESGPSHAAKSAKPAPTDLESAAAADALAKAQLEAALR